MQGNHKRRIPRDVAAQKSLCKECDDWLKTFKRGEGTE